MPHRRTFVAGLGAGFLGLSSPVTGRPAADHAEATTDVDLLRGIDTVAGVSERVTGHLDFAALEALRELDIEALDRRTAADLDRRLAPVLGRGPSRVAGLRTLAGDLDAEAAASRLGPGVSAEGTRLLADLALGEGAPARPTDSERFDADAVTAVTVAADELGAVESFALGVDVDGSFRARVRGEGVSVADAREVLQTLGLSSSLVDGLPPVVRDDWVEFHGSFEARDGRQPFVVALLLVLLAAVVGTFVLGLGDSPQQRVPQVSFSFEFDAEGHAVILHRGGDHVAASRLRIEYTSDGTRRVERWRDSDGTVEAGDSYRTRGPVDGGSRLRVVWTSDDGSTSATIAAVTAPN